MTATTKPKRRRRSDGLATRRRVLDVANELFAAGGYQATSLRQIAGAADIDIATLKYHFDDKPTLFSMVYKEGHEQFVATLAPITEQLEAAGSRQEVRDVVRVLVATIHDFVGQNMAFVRLTMFRLLEESVDKIGLEDELQEVILQVLESKFVGLVERGIIEPVDARALVTFLISSFSMWQITARVRPNWVGEPAIESPAGRERSEMFFLSVIDRILGVEESAA